MRWAMPLLFALALVIGLAPLTPAQGTIASVYSDLAPGKCKTIEVDKETGSSVQNCPGIAGYKLQVLDDDARQSITVITPDRKDHPLNLWQVVTLNFSSVGDKAEWRVVRKQGKIAPIALIVRVRANEDAENPKAVTSYLAVAKITSKVICVTHKILPGAKANENARSAADSAQSAPCLKDVAP